jgi:hypothetical protein
MKWGNMSNVLFFLAGIEFIAKIHPLKQKD